MADDWKKKPIPLEKYDPLKNQLIIGIDESGNTSALKQTLAKIRKGKIDIEDNDRYISLVAIIVRTKDYNNIKNKFNKIKRKYWPPKGMFEDKKGTYKKVVFHDTEISKRKEPFNFNKENYVAFCEDLSNTLKKSNFIILAEFIDLVEFVKLDDNNTNSNLYGDMITLIIEKLCSHLKENYIILCESRDESHDKKTLNTILKSYNKNKSLYKNLNGVYFNHKRNAKKDNSYILLEIADLSCGPFRRYQISNIKGKDYICIEKKIIDPLVIK